MEEVLELVDKDGDPLRARTTRHGLCDIEVYSEARRVHLEASHVAVLRDWLDDWLKQRPMQVGDMVRANGILGKIVHVENGQAWVFFYDGRNRIHHLSELTLIRDNG